MKATLESLRSALVRRAAIAALVGLIANVLVAWALSAFIAPAGALSDLSYGTAARLRDRDIAFTAHIFRGFGVARATITYESETLAIDRAADLFPSMPHNSIASELRVRRVPDPLLESPPRDACIVVAGCGWPCLSFRHDLGMSIVPGRPTTRSEFKGQFRGLDLPLPDWSDFRLTAPVKYPGIDRAARRSLPVSPLWFGLLANSALYAMLAAIPLVIIPSVRVALCCRRHACVTCGYPLGSLARCPECGHAG